MSDVLLGFTCTLAALAVILGVPLASLVMVVRLRGRLAEIESRLERVERARVDGAAPAPGAEVRPSSPREPDRPAAVSVAPVARAPAQTSPPPEPTVTSPAPASDEAAPEPAAAIESPAAAEPPVEPARPVDAPPGSTPPLTLPPPLAPPPPPSRPPFTLPGVETLAVWLAATLGAAGLVIAALFGLALAIEKGYVGPPVRFALAIATGVGAGFLSEVLRSRSYRVPAAALAGAGAAVLYGGLYAGHARYGLLGQPLAMGAMVSVTVVTMLAAVRQDNVLLALLATGGGFLTPILLSTGENKAVAFFTYLALLDAGVVVAATRRRWWPVVGVAGLVTAALHVGWGVRFRAPDQVPVALGAAFVLAILFLALPFRRGTRVAEALAGGLGAVVIGLAGLAFLVPADPLRYDPVSGLPLAWSAGATAALAAAWIPVVAAAFGFVFARQGNVFLRVVGAALGVFAVVVFVAGWGTTATPPWTAIVAVTVGTGVVAAVAARVAGRTPAEGVPFLIIGGLAALACASLGVPSGTPLFGGPVDPWITLMENAAPNAVVAALAVGLAAASSLLGYGFGLRGVLPVGLVAAALPLLPGIPFRLEEPGAGLLFFAAATVYAVHAFPALWRPRDRDLAGTLAAAGAGPVLFTPFLAVWEHAFGTSASGLVALLLGVPTLVGAVGLVRAVRARADSRELAILVMVTLGFAALAVPLQLDEAWLTVGWAVEMVLLAWIGRRLTFVGIRVGAAVLAAAVAVRLLLNPEALEYGGGEGWILLNWTLYTWGVPAVCFLLAARWFDAPPWMPRVLRIVAVLLFFALVNLEVAHAFAHDHALSFRSEDLAESMTRSIAWGAYGLLILVVGFVSNSRLARLGGFAFALLAAAKVCLVDVWNLSGLVRVGSFAGLAVVLILAALVFQKVVLRERET